MAGSDTGATTGARIRVVSLDASNVDDIAELRRRLFGVSFEPHQTLVAAVAAGSRFGVIAYLDTQVVGYRFQQRCAAGIAGLGSMGVAPERRGGGLGRRIVDAHHQLAPADIEVFIVFNSDPKPDMVDVPPDAEQFWAACGYQVIERAAGARILSRRR